MPATWFVCKNCVRCACSFVLWTFWLLLGVNLIFLLRIALSSELQVPAWIIQRMENRHAARGLISHFGSATLDPHGVIFLSNVRILSIHYPEPLLTARSVRVVLDPWGALTRDFGASEIEMHGVELHLPPILSPSGRDEAVLTDLNFSLKISDRDLTIEQFSARCDGLTLNVHGALSIPRADGASDLEPREIVDYILKTYFQSARQLALHTPKIAWFDTPHLDVVLIPNSTRAALAHIRFTALGARLPSSLLPGPLPGAAETIDLGPLSFGATLPLISNQPWTTRLHTSIAQFAAPQGGHLAGRDLDLSLFTHFQPGWKIVPRSLDLAAGSLTVRDASVAASAVSARITGTYPQLHADLAARLFDEPWTIRTDGNLSERSGTLFASTRITPEVLAFASRRTGRDLSAVLKPAAPPSIAVTARFDPGLKFTRAHGRLASGPIDVRRVSLDATAADFSLEGSDLRVNRIRLLTGESEARGSYEMDTRNFDFRFLLTGALRPPAIAGWFSDWWPSFWNHFDFSGSSPPRADIEVSGRWGKPYDTRIFLRAEASRPIIRTVQFDHLHTTLFIRPTFYDGLEFVAARGSGSARGTFTRSLDFEKNALRYNSFDLVTDLDPRENARLFGAIGTDIVEPFIFERPPRLKISGRLDGPAAPQGAHVQARIDLESTGPFTFFGFPLSNLSTRAALADDDLKITDLRVGFAQGYVTGRARLSGEGEKRRLGFDAALENASLGQAIQTLEEFGAYRKNLPPPPRSKFQERLAPGRLGLRLSGDGNYRDPYSFIGSGSGEISGAELAQINLLGGLSEVLRAVRLNFTSLRLTAAQANFKLEGRQLDFSELKITGPTAAIDLTGKYRIDLQQMDFNARVSPFELSRNPLASAVDLVLTPFTNILELKLGGSLERPQWRFAYGPSSLLRSLSGKKSNFDESPRTPAETAPATKELLPPPSLRRR